MTSIRLRHRSTQICFNKLFVHAIAECVAVKLSKKITPLARKAGKERCIFDVRMKNNI